MPNNPFLSIIIPVYNVANYLSACLDSILQQEFTDYEIILVDDGSTDDSSVICDNYAANHTNIRCIHKENGGLPSARQAGFRNANGTYIAFVDSDDWVSSSMFTTMCRYAKETEADIIHCDFIAAMSDRQKECSIPFAPGLYNKEQLLENVYPKMIYSGTYFTFGAAPNIWNKLFKYDLLEKHLFHVPHEIKVGEDWLVTYPCILDANSIYFLKEAHYYYRSRSASLTRHMGLDSLKDLSLFLNTCIKVVPFEKYPFMQKQLQYFFTYQSLLTLVPVFQTLLQEKTMPAGEIKKLFLEECQFPA
ncbi:MAG: glycosyltransferase, partial [Lachnospiraceae bacterium]|nr:glycosyltransferase [Lachnospiraceae bacterium]